jgi:hypothetical protein
MGRPAADPRIDHNIAPMIPAWNARRALCRARPGRVNECDAEAWYADVVDHLRRGIASRLFVKIAVYDTAFDAALSDFLYIP